MERYQMLWDCGQCGTKGLLGLTHRHCPSCGAAQDPKRRYYPEAGAEVAVEDSPYQGADKVCPACDTPNSAACTFCTGCGSVLDGAKAVTVRAEQHAGAAGFATDDASLAAREATERKSADEASRSLAAATAAGLKAQEAASPARWPWFVGVALVLVICGGLLSLLFWKQESALSVTGHTWERRIGIERLEMTSDSAWRDSVPADATMVTCHEEQRSTRSVPDGEDCHDKRVDKGDGTFSVQQECTPRTRSEPVYDTKCTYQVPRWHEIDAAVAKGADLAPSWPAAAIPQPGACLGCGREGGRTEHNVVALTDPKGVAFTCDLTQDRWAAMADGSKWLGAVGVVTGALECDSLKPAP